MLHTFTAGEQRNAADVLKVKQNRDSVQNSAVKTNSAYCHKTAIYDAFVSIVSANKTSSSMVLEADSTADKMHPDRGTP